MILPTTGQGSSAANAGGYAVPAGASQLAPLPWTNVTRVRVRFTEPVAVAQGDLLLSGVATANLSPANYAVAAFAYDAASFTATWKPEAGRVRLSWQDAAARRRVCHKRLLCRGLARRPAGNGGSIEPVPLFFLERPTAVPAHGRRSRHLEHRGGAHGAQALGGRLGLSDPRGAGRDRLLASKSLDARNLDLHAGGVPLSANHSAGAVIDGPQ